MNRNLEKVKNYLASLGYDVSKEDTADGILVLNSEDRGLSNLMLIAEGDVLVIEQHIFNIKHDHKETYKRLLQMNRELIHGAYVLDEAGKTVLFRDTLEMENLDTNELEASLNAFTLSLAENAEDLIAFSK